MHDVMAEEAPKPTRLIARPPRNLLQWLRLREIRPIPHRNLPASVYRNLGRLQTNFCEDGVVSTYIMLVMKIKNICQELRFGPNFNSILTDIKEIAVKFLRHSRFKKQYFLFALENGLLEILFVTLQALYTPWSTAHWMRKLFLVFFYEMIGLVCYDSPEEYRRLLLHQFRSLLNFEDGLMLPLAIICAEQKLSVNIEMQVNYRQSIFLSESLHSHAPDVYYRLWKKFKEGMYIAVTSFEFHTVYHNIVQMSFVVENIVHEAYTLACCVESLFRQPLVGGVRHLILLASLRLQELLWLIHGLLTVWPLYCGCDRCQTLPDRIINAGLTRLIYILVSFFDLVSVSDLNLIEAFFEKLADIIMHITWGYSSSWTWYTLYSVPELNVLLNICENGENVPFVVDMNEWMWRLATVRSIVSEVQRAKLLVEPPFRNIPMQIERALPPNEPILSLLKLKRFKGRVFALDFMFSIKRFHDEVCEKVVQIWPDKQYWRDVNTSD